MEDMKIKRPLSVWINRPVYDPTIFKPMLHLYVDMPAPSLHGNNSETGAKTVNIKMCRRFTCFYVYNKRFISPGPYTSQGRLLMLSSLTVHFNIHEGISFSAKFV